MMFTKKFTSLLLLASCSFLSAAVPMVMADYTTRAPVSLANIADGQKLNCVMTDKQGNKHSVFAVGVLGPDNKVHPVSRAGLLPSKKYDQQGIHGSDSELAIVLGVGNFGGKVAGPLSGSVDATDASVAAAATREACEETSGALDLRSQPGKLATNNMVFSGNSNFATQNCLYVIQDDAVSVVDITVRNQQALNGQIPVPNTSWQENTHAVAIDFRTLHALLMLSRSGQIPQGIPVFFETRSGNTEKIDKHYMGTILAATPLLQRLTGYQFYRNLNGNIYDKNNVADVSNPPLAWIQGCPQRACYEYLRAHVTNQMGQLQNNLSELLFDQSVKDNFPIADFLNKWATPNKRAELIEKMKFMLFSRLFDISGCLQNLITLNTLQSARDATYLLVN